MRTSTRFVLSLAAAIVSLIACLSSASAQTAYTWNRPAAGAGTYQWDSNANWVGGDPNWFPNGGAAFAGWSATFGAPTANETINLNSAYTLNVLNVAAAPGLGYTFSGVGGLTVNTATFSGAGTTTLSSNLTLNGSATVFGGGTLLLNGAGGAVTGNGAITVNAGGSLVVDNSSTNLLRLGTVNAGIQRLTATGITLNGGTFSYLGFNGYAPSDIPGSLGGSLGNDVQYPGALTFAGGASNFNISSGADPNYYAMIESTTLARSPGATASFTAGGGTTLGGYNVYHDPAVWIDSYGNLPAPTVLGFATVGGSDFAVFDNTWFGIRAMLPGSGAADYASPTATNLVANRFNNMTASVTAASAQTVYGLKIAGATTLTQSAGATLTVADLGTNLDSNIGGIIKAAGGGNAAIAGGNIRGPSGNSGGELIITVADANLNIGSNIIDGAVAGTMLTKAGGGRLILGGNDTYSGATYINAGTLVAGSNTALGAGAVTINGGTLDANNGTVTVASLNVASPYAGTINNGAVTSSGGGTISGNLAGTAGLRLAGGMLTLSGANTYSGGTTVNGGTLMLASAGALPAGGELHIQDGATLASTDGLQAVTGNLSINDAGPLAGNAGAPVATINNLSSVNSLSLAIAGGTVNWTGTLHVAGSGTVNLGVDGGSTVNLSGSGVLAPTLVIDSAATVNLTGTGDVLSNTAGIGASGTTVALYYGTSSYGTVYTMNASGHVAVVNNGVLNVAGGGFNQVGDIACSGAAAWYTDVNNPIGSDSDPLTGSLTVSNGSTLVADTIRQGSLTISGGGLVQITDKRPNTTGHTPSSTLYLNQLVIPQNGDGTFAGTLDLTDNDMIIAYGSNQDPYQSIINMVASGCDGGNWDGTGISSSEAQAGALGGYVGVAVVDNASLGDANFDGVVLSQNEILVKYTWYGDNLLAGMVDPIDGSEDVTLLNLGYYDTIGTYNAWMFGDYLYQGQTNSEDVVLLNLGYFGEGAATAMPEPGTLALLALGGLALLRRRSSRQSRG